MMNRMTKEDKIKLAILEMVIPINSNEEAVEVIDGIARRLKKSFTGKEIVELATKYTEGTIKYLSVDEYEGMTLISLPLETDEEPCYITNNSAVLSYVYNVTVPELSELGYCLFKEYDGEIVRVG